MRSQYSKATDKAVRSEVWRSGTLLSSPCAKGIRNEKHRRLSYVSGEVGITVRV